jgi:hypothetical protein
VSLKARTLLPVLTFALLVVAACSSTEATDSGAIDTGPIGEAARAWLVDQASGAVTDPEVVSVEPVDWSDACLGIERPGMMCAQVITPGFRITLRDADGSEHEVRASVDGEHAWAPAHRVRGTVGDHNIAFNLTTDAGEAIAFMPVKGTEFIGFDAGAAGTGEVVEIGFDEAGLDQLLIPVWVARAE